MKIQNQFTKEWTGFQSAPETETQLFAVDASTTAMVSKTRTRRVCNDTYTYSGGSKEAAAALKAEIEKMPGMGEVYGYSNGPDQDKPNSPAVWTVVATLKTIGTWGDWV